MTVLEGSIAAKEVVPSYGSGDRRRRKSLIEDGIFIEEDTGYRLSRDYTFSSPSLAAVIMTGRSTNGWTAWKDKLGRTLHERYRATTEDEAS